MALATMREKLESAKKNYEKQLAELGSGLRDAIAVDGGTPWLGVTAKDLKDLKTVLKDLDDEEYRRAFGDEATVRIYRDGRCEID